MSSAALAVEAPRLDVSDFQARALDVPPDVCIFFGGGKGGGKTRAAALIALRHAGEHGDRAKILWVREDHRGLLDAAGQLIEVLTAAFGPKGFRYNQNDNIFRLDGGGSIELNQVSTVAEYRKFHGRSLSLIIVDECTQWATPSLIDKLRSNLRAPAAVPCRLLVLGNPGDIGHGWTAKRWANRKPWVEYAEDWVEGSDRKWITLPSTLADNPFLNAEAYARELRAACSDDPELARAWIEGDWSIVRGAFFSDVLSNEVTLDDPSPEEVHAAMEEGRSESHPRLDPAHDLYLAHDYGSSAPSITYVILRSGGLHLRGRYFRPGSILLLDELATHRADDLTEGTRATVPELATEIKALAERWACRPAGCADDAIFSETGHAAGSIADEFRSNGVSFVAANKGGRVSGWQRMRTLLSQAKDPDLPGLFVARRCLYWWGTVPVLQRDPRRREDVDTTGPDHGADANRYGIVYQRPQITTGKLFW